MWSEKLKSEKLRIWKNLTEHPTRVPRETPIGRFILCFDVSLSIPLFLSHSQFHTLLFPLSHTFNSHSHIHTLSIVILEMLTRLCRQQGVGHSPRSSWWWWRSGKWWWVEPSAGQPGSGVKLSGSTTCVTWVLEGYRAQIGTLFGPCPVGSQSVVPVSK